MNELTEGLVVLLSWKILATAIAIYAIIAFQKRIITIIDVGRINLIGDNKFYKILLTGMNIILGAGIAFHPTFLPGETLTERMVAGIVAGFLSSYFYQFIRRFFKETKV